MGGVEVGLRRVVRGGGGVREQLRVDDAVAVLVGVVVASLWIH